MFSADGLLVCLEGLSIYEEALEYNEVDPLTFNDIKFMNPSPALVQVGEHTRACCCCR